MELQTINLGKSFGRRKAKQAVSQVNITLTNGVWGLLGANGAGKTTLMRLLCGLQKPSSGQILLDGQAIDRLGAAYYRQIGYLPQHFAYYPDFSAQDFLLYAAALKGLGAAAAQKQARQLLTAVGLAEQARQRIKTFSGGMKQRLGIAQALLGRPRILILDEPTAGLGPTDRVHFRQLLGALGEYCIVLLSTHIISDVEQSAQKIILLRAGQVVRLGNRQELLTATGCNNLEEVYLHYYQEEDYQC